jgi:lysyl-tRNA synthetase class 1
MSEDSQDEEFNIHWIKDVVDQVLEREPDEYLVATGKSMSGSVHVGFMKEIIIADVIKRELRASGKSAKTLFVIDDYDPIRSFPPSMKLSPDEWMGVPYSDAPDPSGCCESLGEHWANELVETFPEFGADPELVWQSKLYETKEMQEAVRICLDNTQTIRDILIEYVARDFDEEQRSQYISSMQEWYPVSVICPVCGRLQSGGKGSIVPNRVKSYNTETQEISYECAHCGHSETTSLDGVRLKLSWRIDWPAKWYVLNITCEPAGKDHAVKGGSYDTGLEISRKVFGWSGPVKVPFEWVRFGGRDMGTSKGRIYTPKSWLEVSPPEVFRYQVLKTNPEKANNILPERIPDMVDLYDRFERVYYEIEDADPDRTELAKLLYPLTESQEVSDSYVPKLPFKFAIVTTQLQELLGKDTILTRCYRMMKKTYDLEELSSESKRHVPIRLTQALGWVNQFGTEQDKVDVPKTIPDQILNTITSDDKEFLNELVNHLRDMDLDDEEIQALIFESARNVNIKPKRAFLVLYRLLISRKSGPRLGPFINTLGTDWVITRIEQAL